jgi:hypothetical protein
MFTMQQISVVEEKPFTSSLNICPQSYYKRGGGRPEKSLPLTPTLVRSWSVDIAFKDDVTVFLLLGVSLLRYYRPTYV